MDEPQPPAPRADAEPSREPASDPGPAPEPASPPPGDDPPGLRGQIGATKDSARRLVGAHVELAKAELGEVADEIKRVAAFVGIAIGAAITAGLLVTVGLPLFIGEWIFGSMGWGLLHGLLLLIALAVAAIVTALRVGANVVTGSAAIGIGVGLIAGVVLGLNLTNRGWSLLGESLLPLTDPGPRALATAAVVLPIVAAVVIGLLALIQAFRGGTSGSSEDAPTVGERATVGLLLALYVGWLAAFIYAYSSRVAWPDLAILGVGVAGVVVSLVIIVIVGRWRRGFALITGVAIGMVIGIPLAGLTALGLGPRVGAAIGVTVGLITWIGMMSAETARRGVDTEEMRKRFVPQKTIDMTKETIEWARARMPLSRRS